ncbi:lantibiotic dehydratase [Luteibacter sp. 22Crub2.1]|uniref:lantibiotic dehydratase n=1 Tax=Luteibacter sp. 22Crub2.1 TaxID=1283288 RepID=UPI0009C708E1|nr:lantibiotic dehydratase [Luteibacter sp. 22Crub2.1]SKB59243.1 thiopeptide-type bacteriocin biosynthesis domain-containing protein [Luteibacter sp. 22Crub2.1]
MENSRQLAIRDTALVRIATLPSDVLRQISRRDGPELDAYLKDLFHDQYIAEAIFFASPGLHARLSRWVDGGQVYKGIAGAFVRYIRRMADRSTPFGTFVSVGTISTGADRTGISLPEWPEMRIEARLKGFVAAKLIDEVVDEKPVKKGLIFRLNDTFAANSETFSFIAYRDRGESGRTYFRIELEASPELHVVIRAASDGATLAHISEKLTSAIPNGEDREEVEKFVESLIECQFLCADDSRSITDGDFFDSFLSKVPKDHESLKHLHSLSADLAVLASSSPGNDAGAYRSLIAKYRLPGSGDDPIIQADLYAGPADDVRTGSVSIELRSRMERAVGAMFALSDPLPWNLSEFASAFVERYGDGEVPLLVALDEANGVPFGGKNLPTAPLVKSVFSKRVASVRPTPVIRTRFAQAMAADFAADTMLDYVNVNSSECMLATETPKTKHDGSRYMLAWCALWDEIGSAGSITVVPEVRTVTLQDPCRVLGRFTSGSDEVRDLVNAIRSEEDDEDGIAVELVHIPQLRFVNLTTRRISAKYAIPIRTAAPSEATTIPLNDILVSVVGRRIVLRSRSLGKQLLVRMSNAHNTNRDENLIFYRFLSAVSTQRSGKIGFSARNWFPGRRYVPGLKIDGVIVSRGSWLFSQADAALLIALKGAERAAIIAQWKRAFGLPDWCSVAGGESDIPFDTTVSSGLRGLADEIVRRNGATIVEHFPSGMVPSVMSSRGRHRHEILMVLDNLRYVRDREVARNAVFAPYSRKVPGSDWLYFKVYAYPANQDAILREIYGRLLCSSPEKNFEKFFFVRYRDSLGTHLRVRFGGSPQKLVANLLPALTILLKEMVDRGLASDFSMASYVPEVMRYGGEYPSLACEDIFTIDSRAYIGILNVPGQTFDKRWEIAAVSADRMLSLLGVESTVAKQAFAARAAADFAMETAMTSDERKRIGSVFKVFRTLRKGSEWEGMEQVDRLLKERDELSAPSWNRFVDGSRELLEAALYSVRWSVIHMMFNRFLLVDHRKQEAIIWDLLRRIYEFDLARGRATKTDLVDNAETSDSLAVIDETDAADC